jgi:3-oxoacyl-[acyl-carrier protein] reductase
MRSLLRKLALVTGSTNNIGKSIAEVLARQDFLVIVTSRHGAEARAVAEALPSTGVSFETDFSDTESVERLFSFVKQEFGRLDVLVNNVAYTKNESILECDLALWEQTINTNLRSYYLCTKLAAEIMMQHGGGAIVNITVSAQSGVKQKFSYTVAKGGINYLTFCAALDLAPFNIRVNAVGSGMVGTPVGYREYVNRPYDNPKIPAGHIGAPEDIAETVSFLVSERAKYIFGAIISVDGGLTLGI